MGEGGREGGRGERDKGGGVSGGGRRITNNLLLFQSLASLLDHTS